MDHAVTPPLTTFYVYLTSGCNCACRHCWIVPEDGGQGADRFLDPALLRRAIVQALPLGLNRIKWTGGEPTLHPQFAALLAMQQEFALAGSLETNGMLITPELAGQLRAAGVGSVSVSLDGATPATHDAIRGVKGGYARTCAGIRLLVQAGYRPELILTLQRSNLAELDAYLDLASELGAGSVKINVMQPILRGVELWQNGEAVDLTTVLAVAERLSAAEAPLSAAVDVPLAFRPLNRILSGAADGVCDILHILGILPRGGYALCGIGEHLAEMVFGDIATADLVALWKGHPMLQALRAGLPERLRGICGECLLRGACRGSCVAANYRAGGGLFAPYWFCRMADEAGLFPESRRQLHRLAASGKLV